MKLLYDLLSRYGTCWLNKEDLASCKISEAGLGNVGLRLQGRQKRAALLA
jgi:hypothetical protein